LEVPDTERGWNRKKRARRNRMGNEEEDAMGVAGGWTTKTKENKRKEKEEAMKCRIKKLEDDLRRNGRRRGKRRK